MPFEIQLRQRTRLKRSITVTQPVCKQDRFAFALTSLN